MLRLFIEESTELITGFTPFLLFGKEFYVDNGVLYELNNKGDNALEVGLKQGLLNLSIQFVHIRIFIVIRHYEISKIQTVLLSLRYLFDIM
jgi:hypothetical protein